MSKGRRLGPSLRREILEFLREEGDATAKEVVEHFISSGKRNVPTKREVWYLIARYKKAGAGCGEFKGIDVEM
ncbi:MAG: hypothetical protein H5T41_02585 [Methanomassiliicoccales archaeon]|nr:hypothetical protein [Methanomassiliicoccales archaeon]